MECPVCFDPIYERHVTPCCDNQIHRECMHECLNNYHSCPLCRQPMHIIEIEPVPQVIDRCTKIWMIMSTMIGAGIVALSFEVTKCK